MTDPRTDTSCPRCKGWSWVCEDHPQTAWNEGCEIEQCGGAGVPCSCNPEARMPASFQVIADAKSGGQDRALVVAIPDLTDDDYDALYVVVKEEMPRITRDIFPCVFAQRVRDGVLSITVTDTEITVAMPDVPETGVYRVERKRRLH